MNQSIDTHKSVVSRRATTLVLFCLDVRARARVCKQKRDRHAIARNEMANEMKNFYMKSKE